MYHIYPEKEEVEMKRMFVLVAVFIGLSVLCSCNLGNQAPTAVVSCDPTGVVAERICFDASGSYDPDGSIVACIWDFGDGISQQAGVQAIEHRYAGTGVFTGSLTVKDNVGATASCPFTVTVNWKPCTIGKKDGEADVVIYLIQETGIIAFIGSPVLFTVELDTEYDVDIVARNGANSSSHSKFESMVKQILPNQVLAETDGIAWVQAVVRKPNGEIITYDTRNQPGSKPLDWDHPRLEGIKFNLLGDWIITIYARDNRECGTQAVFQETIRVGECPACG